MFKFSESLKSNFKTKQSFVDVTRENMKSWLSNNHRFLEAIQNMQPMQVIAFIDSNHNSDLMTSLYNDFVDETKRSNKDINVVVPYNDFVESMKEIRTAQADTGGGDSVSISDSLSVLPSGTKNKDIPNPRKKHKKKKAEDQTMPLLQSITTPIIENLKNAKANAQQLKKSIDDAKTVIQQLEDSIEQYPPNSEAGKALRFYIQNHENIKSSLEILSNDEDFTSIIASLDSLINSFGGIKFDPTTHKTLGGIKLSNFSK